MLGDAGIPFYHDEALGGYRMADTFFLPPLNLTLAEALALLVVTEPADGDGALPLQQEAQAAALKIESALPSHMREHCGRTLRTTSVRYAPHASHDQLDATFHQIQQAIRQCRQIDLTYHSLQEKQIIEIRVHPYHLHFSQRAWYLIGHSCGHDEVRTFKLSRIRNFELLPDRFVVEKPFHIDEYLGKAWSLIPEGRVYHVKLLFASMVAQNVAEVLWHHTQQTNLQADGKLLYEVEVDGLKEISWWIMGYGDQVEVLAPDELRRRVARMARNLAAIYETIPPAPQPKSLGAAEPTQPAPAQRRSQANKLGGKK